MDIPVEKLLEIIGAKDVEIYVLQKQIAELQKLLADLEKPKEEAAR
jgi:hypothetical protein